jgi:predicted MPP superfamily phosphohydrolase
MRRRTLDPPESRAHEAVHHVPLQPPHEASTTPRPRFDPKQGWFRRIERAASLFLSRHVFPRMPGAHLPYSAILRAHLTVAEAEIPVAGLPAAFDGVTLLFISDIHAGPFLSVATLRDALRRLSDLHADAVIHGGDLSTSNVQEAVVHADSLKALTAPLGCFAVYGNHDHYTKDAAGIAALYERCGIRLLNNDAVALERGGSRIALAGIDDWNFGKPDVDEALARSTAVAPGAPVVLISHNPDAFLQAAAKGIALTLSGHTHGGQVRIPGRPVLVRMSRYRLDEGRYERGGCQLVVSRGLGVSGIPFRLFCPPEAVLVTLRPPLVRSPRIPSGVSVETN